MLSVHYLSRRSVLSRGAASLAAALLTMPSMALAAEPEGRAPPWASARALGRGLVDLLKIRPADSAEQLRMLLHHAEAGIVEGQGMVFREGGVLIVAFRHEFPSATAGHPSAPIANVAMLADRLDINAPQERNTALAALPLPSDARVQILQREGTAHWRLAIATFRDQKQSSTIGITEKRNGWILRTY